MISERTRYVLQVIGAVLLVLAFGTWIARAETVPDLSAAKRAAIEARVPQLLNFASVVTGLKIMGKPKIVFRTDEQLARIYFGDNYRPELAGWVAALTANDTIMLSEGFKLGQDDYVLAHELTHYLQFQNAKYHDSYGAEHVFEPGQTCTGLAEPEAYHTGDVYVAATGVGKVSDGMTVFSIVAACFGQ